ncbi:AtpZ/AtpI family protein [bacterium]|nr:AtpZ/AtpI family protein [bacterium]
MDFRFKYRRGPVPKEQRKEEERIERDRLTRLRGLAIGISIPASMVSGPLLGWLAGSWLDRALGTGFWMITLVLLGTAAGLKVTFDMLIRLGRQ